MHLQYDPIWARFLLQTLHLTSRNQNSSLQRPTSNCKFPGLPSQVTHFEQFKFLLKHSLLRCFENLSTSVFVIQHHTCVVSFSKFFKASVRGARFLSGCVRGCAHVWNGKPALWLISTKSSPIKTLRLRSEDTTLCVTSQPEGKGRKSQVKQALSNLCVKHIILTRKNLGLLKLVPETWMKRTRLGAEQNYLLLQTREP